MLGASQGEGGHFFFSLLLEIESLEMPILSFKSEKLYLFTATKKGKLKKKYFTDREQFACKISRA